MKNDEIKLLRGNCLELAEQIPDGSIDMVLCDPPYGVTDCRWDSVLPFDAMWRMYERVVKANGTIALFSSQPFTTRLIHSNICQYRYTWYWVKNIKTGHVFAKVQPMRQVEEVCIFYRRKPLYQPQGLVKLEREIIHRKQAQADAVYRLDKRANASVQRYGNYPSNVLRFDVDSGKNRVHPSQKPVALLEYLIRNKGVVLSRIQIEENIWGFDYEGSSNIVDVYIRYLRRKIDKDHPVKLIHTIRGSGYVLKLP